MYQGNEFIISMIQSTNIVLKASYELNLFNDHLYFQEENLDSQQGVIDLSLYLRTKFDGEVTSPKSEPAVTQSEDAKNMSAVLDQKSYIEELNRHLK